MFTTIKDEKEKTKKLLQEYAELLPKGAIARIAEKSGFSLSYVSRFFNGDYNVTHENEKLLSIGIEILEDAQKEEVRTHDKVAQKLAEAKNINTNTTGEF